MWVSGVCREFPSKEDRLECKRGGKDGFFMSFLNLFLKRFNNAKGFKLSNKSQKEILPCWHRLHTSLTVGSEKHMQKMDVLLHCLLLFRNLEQKRKLSSKSELTEWFTAFLHTGQKIMLYSGKRKPRQGLAHHLQSGMIPVCRSQYSKAVKTSAGQDTEKDQMKTRRQDARS